MDFDPRDSDSRDEERFAPSRERDGRGAFDRDQQRDDEWSRPANDSREPERETPGHDRDRDDSRESHYAGRYRDTRDDLRQPERDRDDRTRDNDPRDVFTGVSGAKDRGPALDTLVRDAKRRRFDVLVCWRLDRLGRNLRHLILLLDELQALGVGFVSLSEGIDATTPAGRLQLHVLGAIAEFERERIRERVLAGLQRAKAQGQRLGRPNRQLPPEVLQMLQSGPVSVRSAAERSGVSRATAHRWLRQAKAV